MNLGQARWTIAVLGILAPYLARIPGAFLYGTRWLTSYFGDVIWAPLFFGAFNAVCWVPAVLATRGYRHASSAWFPAVGALGSSAALHATIDLAADAQAAIALVVIPFYTLPFTLLGWWLGRRWDVRRSQRSRETAG